MNNNERKTCTCGKSKTPPYCDQSHEHLEEAETVAALKELLAKSTPCTCGRSKDGIHCDDSHQQIEALLNKLIKIKSNTPKEEKGDFDF